MLHTQNKKLRYKIIGLKILKFNMVKNNNAEKQNQISRWTFDVMQKLSS
jgi:hypothetical protein